MDQASRDRSLSGETLRFWMLSGIFLAVVSACSIFVAMRIDDRSYRLLEAEETATAAAVQALSDLRRWPLEEVLASIEAPGGFEGGPGRSFPVSGLEQGRGTLEAFHDETFQTLPDASLLGLPMDLNGDGDAEDRAVTKDLHLLPIRVAITWDSEGGPRELFHYAVLSRNP